MALNREKMAEGLTDGIAEGFIRPEIRELESQAKSEKVSLDLLRKRAAPATPKLSRIAELILGVDARTVALPGTENESELKSSARGQLAASLGCTSQDLDIVVESYGDAWEGMILEERIRLGIDSTSVRDATWDRLESSVLRKLIHLVDANLVKEVGELVAIAKTANGAIRGERKGSGSRPSGDGTPGIQNNIYLQGDPANGVLPAGNLGKITLNLTPRLVKQIESTAVHHDKRQIDSMEMMNLKDVQEAVVLAETDPDNPTPVSEDQLSGQQELPES